MALFPGIRASSALCDALEASWHPLHTLDGSLRVAGRISNKCPTSSHTYRRRVLKAEAHI